MFSATTSSCPAYCTNARVSSFCAGTCEAVSRTTGSSQARKPAAGTTSAARATAIRFASPRATSDRTRRKPANGIQTKIA